MDNASEDADADAVSVVDNVVSIIEAELETLKAIFIHELDVSDQNDFPITLMLNLEPATADRKEECFVCLTLSITVAKEYPESLPKVLIKNSRGLSDEGLQRILKDIHLKAEVLKGNPMLFELIDVAKEYLTFWNMPSCECAICLYEFSQEDVFTKTECYHYFHSHCLTKYVKYSKEKFEEEQPSGSGIVPKTFQAECPVCRVAIHFVGESDELYPAPSAASTIDESFEISDDIKEIQEKLSSLYEKQKAQGGIIDLEEEKNKFLIEISSVPTVSLSTIAAIPDDKVKGTPQDQPKRETLHKDSQYLKKKALAKKMAASCIDPQSTVENDAEEIATGTEIDPKNDTETEIEKDKSNVASAQTKEKTSKNIERDNRDYNGRYQNRGYNRNYRGNSSYEDRNGRFGNYRQDNKRFYNNGYNGYNNRDNGYNNRDNRYNNRDNGYNNRDNGYSNRANGYNNRDNGYNNRDNGYNNRNNGYNNRDNYYANDRRPSFRSNGNARREKFSSPRNSQSKSESSDNTSAISRNRRNSRGSFSARAESETAEEVVTNGDIEKVDGTSPTEKQPANDMEKFQKRPNSVKSRNNRYRNNNEDHNSNIDIKSGDITRAAPSRRNRYSSRYSAESEETKSVASVNNESPKSDQPSANLDDTDHDKHDKIPSKYRNKRPTKSRNKLPQEPPLVDKLNKEYEGFVSDFKEDYQRCDECGSTNRTVEDGVSTYSKDLEHKKVCSVLKRAQQDNNPRYNARNNYRGGRGRPQGNRPFRGFFRRPYYDNPGRQGSYNRSAAQNSKMLPTDIEENSEFPANTKPKAKPDNSPKILHPAAKFHPPGIPVTKPSISTLSTENL